MSASYDSNKNLQVHSMTLKINQSGILILFHLWNGTISESLVQLAVGIVSNACDRSINVLHISSQVEKLPEMIWNQL